MPTIYPGTQNQKDVQPPNGRWNRVVATQTPNSQQSDKVQRVQARVAQHHYVRAELHDINENKADGLLRHFFLAIGNTPAGKTRPLEVWERMRERLQSADLTINFKAKGFFAKPNNSTSYMQMYEKAVRDVNGNREMRLVDNDLNNPKRFRSQVDDEVTFRGDWADMKKGFGRVMSPGRLQKPTVDAKKQELEAGNIYFNPKSKQVFAALNYGRRPHGASILYGMSYFVLNERFKTNAIYFAGDTFDYEHHMVTANDHISFDLIAALYARANQKLRKDLYESCYCGIPQAEDVQTGDYLVEAHLFEPLTFTGNIEKIYLCNEGDLGEMEWMAVRQNASHFAAKHGAKVIEID